MLTSEGARYVAVANPETAPYGRAAAEVIKALGLEATFEARRVMGENIGQTFAFVRTGNADMGFIAASQLSQTSDVDPASLWWPPEALYTPIRQNAVLLARGQDNLAALAFLEYLASAPARARIVAGGYKVE